MYKGVYICMCAWKEEGIKTNPTYFILVIICSPQNEELQDNTIRHGYHRRIV